MVKTRKVEWVEDLTELIETNRHMIFTDFKGLTVEESEQLRRELYELDSDFCVVKNRLAKLAFREAAPQSETADAGDEEDEVELQELDGVGPSKVEKIQASGYESVSDLAEASLDELEEISGVGPSLAEKIQDSAGELLPENGGGDDDPGDLVDDVDPLLAGNTAIVFSDAQVSRVAEAVVDFQEEHESLSIKAGVVEGDLYDPDSIEEIAELPSRHEMLTSLAVGLNSPIQKLAQYLKNPIVKFVNVLDQVKEQKEEEE